MAQKYERLIQEDLSCGDDLDWTQAPAGGELRTTQLGLHTFARGQIAYEATWAPGSIAAGSKASTTLTVPDADPGDFVIASHDKALTGDVTVWGNIAAADTAQVVIHNPTAAAVTVASGTVRVLVFPAAAPITTGTVTGTVTVNTNPTDEATVDMTLDGNPYDSTTPNAQGVYTFSDVPAGAVVVTATGNGTWQGYSGTNNGTLTSGETLTLDIAMQGV